MAARAKQPPAVTSLPPESLGPETLLELGPDTLLELVWEHLATFCGERAYECRQRYNAARACGDGSREIWLDQAEIWDGFRDQYR